MSVLAPTLNRQPVGTQIARFQPLAAFRLFVVNTGGGSVTGTGARQIAPEEWLASAEKFWRPQLESTGLAVEVLPEANKTNKAAQAFGMLYSASPARGYRALLEHPAALVMAFTGVATNVYEGGTFWPGFWKTCGYQATPNEQVDWGDAFLRGLRVLSLPTFPGLPKRVLGPLLLHTGIPTYCLSDYFQVLEVGMRRVGADADALVHWVIPRLDSTFPNIDVPVRRFLQFGGEYAIDFVDQSLDALLVLTEDPDAVVSSLIPERVIDAARDFLAADRTRARAIKQRGDVKPRISVKLDPYAGELKLQLPALDSFDEELIWKISADGENSRVRPDLALGGWTVSVLESFWRIDKPTRSISVSADDLDTPLDITLVRDHDPILFFQENGELLPSHMALPPESVWVLYAPPSLEPEPDFAPRILRTELPPLGWAGWALALVDLAELPEIRLSKSHPTHSIRTQSRATLSTGSEISWITTHGLPVQTKRPTLHLPDNISATWRLRITDLDSSEVIADRLVDSHEESHDALDPFDSLPTPLVGRFEVSVKGPFGRGVVRNFAIVEGLTVDPPHPWRSLAVGGLEPLVLRASGAGISCEPGVLSFGPDQSALHSTVRGQSQSAELTVTPPAMAVATLRSSIASRWSFGLVRLHVEEIAEYQLLVKIQPGTVPCDLRVRVGDRVVQSLSPSTKSAFGYANYALDVIADTARANSGCDLFTNSDNSEIRVARVEPKRIATGATATGSRVSLTDFTGGDVEIRVWSLFAPWIPPAHGTVDYLGEFPLPSHFIGQAPYAASWQRSDPWIPCEWPWMPHHFECTVVHADSESSQLCDASQVLAGQSISPVVLNQHHAWSLLGMASRLPREYVWDRVQALTASLRANPDGAMRSLIDVPIPAADRLTLLIRSGVLWARSTSAGPDGLLTDDSLRLLRSEQVIGPLLVLARLIEAPRDGLASECWRTLREVYGNEIISILSGDTDPSFKGGTFANAKALSERSVEDQDHIISQAQLVPRALLDIDSRSSAALALFQQRDNPELLSVGRDGRNRLKIQSEILRDWHWDAALTLLEARADARNRGGWLSLSAQSIGFALVARLAAQGDEHAETHLDAEFRHWLALAECAPQIVTVDLVLAEAMALAAFHSSIPTNPFADDTDESDSE